MHSLPPPTTVARRRHSMGNILAALVGITLLVTACGGETDQSDAASRTTDAAATTGSNAADTASTASAKAASPDSPLRNVSQDAGERLTQVRDSLRGQLGSIDVAHIQGTDVAP